MVNHFRGLLQLYQDASIYHAVGQVVRYGILVVGYVGYPVVTAYVVKAEDVETVEPEPDVAQEFCTTQMVVFVVDEAVVHADIKATIGWCSEAVAFQTRVWRAKRKAVGEGCL